MTRGVLAVWVAWTVVVVVALVHHEMARDELQAWSIAREASSPLDLLANLRYEGHPPGWHLLLWGASLVTRAPVAAQVLNGAVAAAAAWIVLRHLPFTAPVRVLLVVGYFPLYELGAISRSYGLLYLLVVAFLALADRRSGWSVDLVLLLIAAANTLALALPLVVGLAAAQSLRWGVARRRLLLVGAVVAVGCGLALALSLVPGDGNGIDPNVPDQDGTALVLRAPARALLPAADPVVEFWNRFATERLGRAEVLLGIAAAVGVTVAVRRSRPALVVWAVGGGGFIVLVSVLGLPMAARQVSVLWVTLVATAWIAGTDALARPAAVPDRGRTIVAVAAVGALLVGATGSAWALAVDGREPFSGAEGAAEWVRENTTEPVAVLCAVRRPYCSAVALSLDEPAYVQADVEPFTFVEWRRDRPRPVEADELVAEAATLGERTGREVVVVATADELPAGCEAGWVSPPTIDESERMAVCRAEDLSGSESSSGEGGQGGEG